MVTGGASGAVGAHEGGWRLTTCWCFPSPDAKVVKVFPPCSLTTCSGLNVLRLLIGWSQLNRWVTFRGGDWWLVNFLQPVMVPLIPPFVSSWSVKIIEVIHLFFPPSVISTIVWLLLFFKKKKNRFIFLFAHKQTHTLECPCVIVNLLCLFFSRLKWTHDVLGTSANTGCQQHSKEIIWHLYIF